MAVEVPTKIDLTAKVAICDIEGTTTSIDFVKDTLFPYAQKNVKDYLFSNWEKTELKEVVSSLVNQAKKDAEAKIEGVVPIPEEEYSLKETDKTKMIDALVKNVEWQIENDRKTGPLKTLQGLIWELGYKEGVLRGHIYDDVPNAFQNWTSAGIKIYIYSSGSVHAQKLLFSKSEHGDMLPFISGHFDTGVGAKQEKNSYLNILKELKQSGEDVVFLTDIPNEAKAAKDAGITSVLLTRPGNSPLTDNEKIDFKVAKTFDDIVLINSLASEGNKRKNDDDATDQEPAPKILKKEDNIVENGDDKTDSIVMKNQVNENVDLPTTEIINKSEKTNEGESNKMDVDEGEDEKFVGEKKGEEKEKKSDNNDNNVKSVEEEKKLEISKVINQTAEDKNEEKLKGKELTQKTDIIKKIETEKTDDILEKIDDIKPTQVGNGDRNEIIDCEMKNDENETNKTKTNEKSAVDKNAKTDEENIEGVHATKDNDNKNKNVEIATPQSVKTDSDKMEVDEDAGEAITTSTTNSNEKSIENNLESKAVLEANVAAVVAEEKKEDEKPEEESEKILNKDEKLEVEEEDEETVESIVPKSNDSVSDVKEVHKVVAEPKANGTIKEKKEMDVTSSDPIEADTAKASIEKSNAATVNVNSAEVTKSQNEDENVSSTEAVAAKITCDNGDSDMAESKSADQSPPTDTATNDTQMEVDSANNNSVTLAAADSADISKVESSAVDINSNNDVAESKIDKMLVVDKAEKDEKLETRSASNVKNVIPVIEVTDASAVKEKDENVKTKQNSAVSSKESPSVTTNKSIATESTVVVASTTDNTTEEAVVPVATVKTINTTADTNGSATTTSEAESSTAVDARNGHSTSNENVDSSTDIIKGDSSIVSSANNNSRTTELNDSDKENDVNLLSNDGGGKLEKENMASSATISSTTAPTTITSDITTSNSVVTAGTTVNSASPIANNVTTKKCSTPSPAPIEAES